MNTAAALVVLAIHGGGFSGGSPADVAPACELARAEGARCVLVEYPFRDLPGAVRKVRRVAERYRNPVAYGESAGGFLAARLAYEGRVERAAVVGAPLNLVKLEYRYDPDFWAKANITMAQRERYSITGQPQQPIRLLDSKQDTFVPWQLNDPLVRLKNVTRRWTTGEHVQDPTATGRAIRWLLP